MIIYDVTFLRTCMVGIPIVHLIVCIYFLLILEQTVCCYECVLKNTYATVWKKQFFFHKTWWIRFLIVTLHCIWFICCASQSYRIAKKMKLQSLYLVIVLCLAAHLTVNSQSVYRLVDTAIGLPDDEVKDNDDCRQASERGQLQCLGGMLQDWLYLSSKLLQALQGDAWRASFAIFLKFRNG